MSNETRNHVRTLRIRSTPNGLAAAVACLAPLAWAAEPKTSTSPLTVEAIEIDPARPGPEALCKLKVTIRNGGPAHQASALAFKVSVNGESLSVYERHVWMQGIAPGTRSAVDLYNFWTPAKGSDLTVEVALVEAKWLKRTKDADEWAGLVPGLPVSKTLKVPLTASRR